jgi:hypothetical protein
LWVFGYRECVSDAAGAGATSAGAGYWLVFLLVVNELLLPKERVTRENA